MQPVIAGAYCASLDTARGTASQIFTAAALVTCTLPVQCKAIVFEFKRHRDRFIQSTQAAEFIEYRVDTR